MAGIELLGDGIASGINAAGMGGYGFIDELLDVLAGFGIAFDGRAAGSFDELLDVLAGGGSAFDGRAAGSFDELLDVVAGGDNAFAINACVNSDGAAGIGIELAGRPSPRHEIKRTGMERASPHKGLFLPIESSGLHLAWLSDEPTFPESL